MLYNFTCVGLIFFVYQIKGNLESLKIIVNLDKLILFLANQFLQQNRRALGQPKMELTLCDFVIIKTKALWLVLINQKDHTENFIPEVFLLYCLDCKCKSVTKHFFWIFRFLNRFLHFIATASLQSDSNCLLKFSFIKALIKLFVYDGLHFWINFYIFLFF